MKKLVIRCPSCSKVGFFSFTPIKDPRGIMTLNVGKDQICSHSFVIYVDKYFDVRDCLLIDFQVEIPQMKTDQKIDKKSIIDLDVVNVDLVKIYIFALNLAYILRSCFHRKKVLFLCDEEHLHSQILIFFNYIFENSFEIDISIEKTNDYKKNKSNFKNHIVLQNGEVLRDKSKILDLKQTKIERQIIQKFLAEYDAKSSLIILKSEIHKIFQLSKELIKIINNYDKKETLGKAKIIDILKHKVFKISFLYLEFLIDIVKNYFNFNVSAFSEYYFPAFGL